MVEFYENRLCVWGGWLYGEGDVMSKTNYCNLTSRKHLQVLRKACRNTPALVDFESMPDRFKAIIVERVGNLYELAKENQLIQYIQPNADGLRFFQDYRFGDNDERSLPQEAQLEYYTNVMVIKAVHILFTDRKARRRALGGVTSKIWEEICSSVNRLDKTKYPHALPSNYRRLKEKHKAYQKEGEAIFIHKGYCNRNTGKLNDEVKLWILSQWANNIERMTSEEHLLQEYNEYAETKRNETPGLKNIWKEVKSVNTIHNFLHSKGIKPLWWGARYGEQKAKEKFMFQHSTLMPTMRDSLWYSDGTKLNYYYLDENGKISTIQVYEVMDAYSEVMLGYCISKSENYEAQHEAYKMALEFSGYKPYQITYDGQGGHKKLEAANFLTSLSHLAIKTQPYNGKSKTIESAFGRYQKQYLKRDWFFTGQNITAHDKESRANLEYILANKENLPSFEEMKKAYLKRREQWNNAAHYKTGKPRIEMYRESKNPKSVKISIMDMVELFCITRKTPVRVTAYGMRFTEDKKNYNYMVYNGDLPNVKWIADHVDQKFVVKYDPTDRSTIYLYQEGSRGLEYVCMAKEKLEIHRGIQEQEDWESTYIKQIEAKKKETRIANRDKMDDMLKDNNLLPEQNGLNSPRIKGLETSIAARKTKPMVVRKAKKERTKSIAEIQKDISNAVALGDFAKVDELMDAVNQKHPVESTNIYDRM